MRLLTVVSGINAFFAKTMPFLNRTMAQEDVLWALDEVAISGRQYPCVPEETMSNFLDLGSPSCARKAFADHAQCTEVQAIDVMNEYLNKGGARRACRVLVGVYVSQAAAMSMGKARLH